MYEPFWDLSHKPFCDVMADGCCFLSDDHQGVVLKLQYALDQFSDAVVLTGISGVGKTILTTHVLANLNTAFAPRTHITYTHLDPTDLMGYIIDEVTGESWSQLPTPRRIGQFRDFLAQNAARGQHAVLVVDEAHLLRDPQCWEMLRLLLNFNPAGRQLLTLLLVGQPGLLTSLAQAPSLDERIVVKAMLRPLNVDETGRYINFRLSNAGGTIEIFHPDAIRAVHELTSGVPRRIDRYCDLAMLVAFSEDRRVVEEAHVRSVAQEFTAFDLMAA